MADETNDPFDDAEAFDDLSEVRRALEAVERRQRTAARERRRLRAQLDGVLNALREDAIVLFFDADRELVEAEGPLQEQLGASAAELLADFEDFADEETFDALDEANKAVLEDEAAGACVSDGFLHGDDEDLAVTFIHLRRSDEDGELLGTEAIGLVAPAVESDEELDHDPDPFEMLLGQIGRRLIDDGSEASVERAAQNVGEFLLADRVVVNRYDEDARRFSMAESWLRSDTRPLAAEERGIPISEIPWAYSALGAGEHVVISEDSDLPADARNEKKLFASEGASSTLLVPMLRRDALIGFVSIQSTKGPRVWSDGDISRARNLVMLLAAALVRADVEEELDQAREDAEQAMARGEKAEARAVEAETLAEKASVALAAAGAEVKSLADKVSALESESERARDKERAAQEDAERAQRRSEDAAADALAVRQELEKMRDQLARTLHDDADLRAGSPAAAFTGPPAAPKINEEEDEADIVEDDEEDIFEVDLEEVDDAPAPWSSRPRGDDDLDPDAVFKMNIEDFGRSFDPDATLEMDAVREAAATSEDDDIADPGDAEESKDPLRTGGLDAMLEHTQASTEEGTPEKWKEEKASWEDSTGEVDLPEFLAERDEDDDEEDEDIVEFEIDGESDVDAARRVARDAAGRDEDDDESEERVGGLPPVILPDYMQRPGDSSAPGPDGRTDEPEAEVQPEPETLPSLAGIDTEVGLEDVGGNVELYRDLLTKFRRDYIGASSKINAAIDKGNIEVAHLLLHAVKGVSGVLGALRVRETADDLESKLIGGDPDAMRASMSAFSGALSEVLDSIGGLDASGEVNAIGELDADDTGDEPQVSDPMVLRSYLSGLRQHLVAETPRQCQLVMREITARNWPGDYNARVGELASMIDAADFEAARHTFAELMATFAER